MTRSSLRQPRRGTALIVVMWSLFALVAMALAFGHGQAVAYRETDARIAAAQARWAIEGAARYIEATLSGLESPGRFPAAEGLHSEDGSVGDARFWMLGRPGYGLVDEAAKINLNTATLAMLEALPRMTPERAAAILDWRDADDTPRPGGAESAAYLLRRPAYSAKNAPFESVEELLLVEGFDAATLFGSDANRNGLADAWETPDDGSREPGLADFLTVWSSEPNLQADGTPRVNVNGPAPLLLAALTEPLGAVRAAAVVQRLRSEPGPVGSVVEVFHRGGLTAEEFDQVSDRLSATADPVLRGRVNVNTATAEVLAVLPGLDSGLAARLVAARPASAASTASLSWVFSILEAGPAREVGPYLTSRSFQVSADIAAVGREGRGYQRRRIVFDLSTGTPRRVYQQDLARLGWALGEMPERLSAIGNR